MPCTGRASLQEAISNNVLTWFIQKMPESASFFLKMPAFGANHPHSLLGQVKISEKELLIFSVSAVLTANPHHSVGSCPVIFESSVS